MDILVASRTHVAVVNIGVLVPLNGYTFYLPVRK